MAEIDRPNLPASGLAEPLRATPGQWVALVLVGMVALLSSLGYPVYYRYTAHAVSLVVSTPAGAAVAVPCPGPIYSQERERRSLNRLAPVSSLPILAARIRRYMATVAAGDCAFRWTIRYSADAADLGAHQELVFAGRRCP